MCGDRPIQPVFTNHVSTIFTPNPYIADQMSESLDTEMLVIKVSRHLSDDQIYDIEIHYQDLSWKVVKTYESLQKFHSDLSSSKISTIADFPEKDINCVDGIESYLKTVIYDKDIIFNNDVILSFLDESYHHSKLSLLHIRHLNDQIRKLQTALEDSIQQRNELSTLLSQQSSSLSTTTATNASMNPLITSVSDFTRQGKSSSISKVSKVKLSVIDDSSSLLSTSLLLSSHDNHLQQQQQQSTILLHEDDIEDEKDLEDNLENKLLLDTLSSIQQENEDDVNQSNNYEKIQWLPVSLIPQNTTIDNDIDISIEAYLLMISPHDEQLNFRKSMHTLITQCLKRTTNATNFETSLYSLFTFLPDDGMHFNIVHTKYVSTSWGMHVYERLMRLSRGTCDSSMLINHTEPTTSSSTSSSSSSTISTSATFHPHIDNISSYSNNTMSHVTTPTPHSTQSTSHTGYTTHGTDSSTIMSLSTTTTTTPPPSITSSMSSTMTPAGPPIMDTSTMMWNDDLDCGNYDMFGASHMLYEFQFSNVNHSIVNNESVINFTMNNLPIEISNQSSEHLAYLAFLEEFSILVGKHFLFKKTLLLVKSWWFYEISSYIGCNMKHYLSENTLAILLCCIFNTHHDVIHTPFQGLCYFLSIYGALDWQNSIVTLQGILPINNSSSNNNSTSTTATTSATRQESVPAVSVSVLTPRENQLVTQEMIQKYQALCPSFIIKPTTTSTATATNTTTTATTTTSTVSVASSTIGHTTTTAGAAAAMEDEKSTKSGSNKDNINDMNKDHTADDIITTTTTTTTTNSITKSTASPTFELSINTSPSAVPTSPQNHPVPPILKLDCLSSNTSTTAVTDSDKSLGVQTQSGTLPSADSTTNPTTNPTTIIVDDLRKFEYKPLNILHPFLYTNIIHDKINLRQAKRIMKVFQMGARNMHLALKAHNMDNVIISSPNTTTSMNEDMDALSDMKDMIQNQGKMTISQNIMKSSSNHPLVLTFYRNAYNRFQSGWRPDIGPKLKQIDLSYIHEFNRRILTNTTTTTSTNTSINGMTSSSVVYKPEIFMFSYMEPWKFSPNLLNILSKTRSLSTITSIDTIISDSIGDHDTSSSSSLITTTTSNGKRSIYEYIWNQYNYVCMLNDGIVNDMGLKILCKETLYEKGTLPVGEIGKMLAEYTSISNLSHKLKEKYGGLKKYLEKFPFEFVISTDHPFNPHVFLRKVVSNEELDIITRGLVPPSFTAKFKKTKVKPPMKSNMNMNTTTTTNSTSTNNGNTQLLNMSTHSTGSSHVTNGTNTTTTNHNNNNNHMNAMGNIGSSTTNTTNTTLHSNDISIYTSNILNSTTNTTAMSSISSSLSPHMTSISMISGNSNNTTNNNSGSGGGSNSSRDALVTNRSMSTVSNSSKSVSSPYYHHNNNTTTTTGTNTATTTTINTSGIHGGNVSIYGTNGTTTIRQDSHNNQRDHNIQPSRLYHTPAITTTNATTTNNITGSVPMKSSNLMMTSYEDYLKKSTSNVSSTSADRPKFFKEYEYTLNHSNNSNDNKGYTDELQLTNKMILGQLSQDTPIGSTSNNTNSSSSSSSNSSSSNNNAHSRPVFSSSYIKSLKMMPPPVIASSEYLSASSSTSLQPPQQQQQQYHVPLYRPHTSSSPDTYTTMEMQQLRRPPLLPSQTIKTLSSYTEISHDAYDRSSYEPTASNSSQDRSLHSSYGSKKPLSDNGVFPKFSSKFLPPDMDESKRYPISSSSLQSPYKSGDKVHVFDDYIIQDNQKYSHNISDSDPNRRYSNYRNTENTLSNLSSPYNPPLQKSPTHSIISNSSSYMKHDENLMINILSSEYNRDLDREYDRRLWLSESESFTHQLQSPVIHIQAQASSSSPYRSADRITEDNTKLFSTSSINTAASDRYVPNRRDENDSRNTEIRYENIIHDSYRVPSNYLSTSYLDDDNMTRNESTNTTTTRTLNTRPNNHLSEYDRSLSSPPNLMNRPPNPTATTTTTADTSSCHSMSINLNNTDYANIGNVLKDNYMRLDYMNEMDMDNNNQYISYNNRTMSQSKSQALPTTNTTTTNMDKHVYSGYKLMIDNGNDSGNNNENNKWDRTLAQDILRETTSLSDVLLYSKQLQPQQQPYQHESTHNTDMYSIYSNSHNNNNNNNNNRSNWPPERHSNDSSLRVTSNDRNSYFYRT